MPPLINVRALLSSTITIMDELDRNALLSPIAKIFVTAAILMTLTIVFLCQKCREMVKRSLGEKASEITRELLKWYEIPYKQSAVNQMQKIIFITLRTAAANSWKSATAIFVAKRNIKKFCLDNHMWEKLVKKACRDHEKWHNKAIGSGENSINIQKEAMSKLLRTSLWILLILLVFDVVFPIGQKDVLAAAAAFIAAVSVVVAPLIYFKTKARQPDRIPIPRTFAALGYNNALCSTRNEGSAQMKLIETKKIRQELPCPQQNFLLTDNTIIVGMPMAIEVAKGWLNLTICTLPNYQGKGYATAATQLLIAWATKNGYEKVTLSNVSGSRAIDKVARKLKFTQRPGIRVTTWDKYLVGPLNL